MANFNVIGIIDAIKYMPQQNGCLVFLSEYKRGYRKNNGDIVEGKFVQWKCIFNQSFVKYISKHFNTRMLVEVKGEVLPYAVEHDNIVNGYSVIGQTMNLYSYPRLSAKTEKKMIRETMQQSDEKPALKDWQDDDFL